MLGILKHEVRQSGCGGTSQQAIRARATWLCHSVGLNISPAHSDGLQGSQAVGRRAVRWERAASWDGRGA